MTSRVSNTKFDAIYNFDQDLALELPVDLPVVSYHLRDVGEFGIAKR